MKAMEAILWITSICVGMRKSQSNTLADLVAVAVRIGRVSLAELGRLLAAERDMAAKHAIKRAWRFTCNPGVHVAEAMQGPLGWLFHSRRRWKNRPLVVSFDWTQVRDFHTLMAAAVIREAGACRCGGPVTKPRSFSGARTSWKKACCGGSRGFCLRGWR